MGSEQSYPVVSTVLLWNWDENWPFPVLWPLLGFKICWHIECSILTSSSFSILNGSAGIPSHPLALFMVMLPKAHLTSHSRMSGSTWVTNHCGYPGHWDLFCAILVYLWCLFPISSASVKSLLFPSFIMPVLAGNIPLISPIFLKSSLVFPILLFSSISLHY